MVRVFYFYQMIDYLIIGCGLAGISFSEVVLKKDKSILVYNDHSQNSSVVAGGLYNPVILKRFSALNSAQEQILFLHDFYSGIENKLNVKVNFPLPLLRKLFSVEELNNWFIASDKVGLSPFLSTKIVKKEFSGIDSPFGYGEVFQTGYVDTAKLLNVYQDYLHGINALVNETLDYSQIQIHEDYIEYKGHKAKHVIFAEGFGIHSNPFFKHLPLDGTKGELFIIKAPDLNLDVIVNTSVFILPLGDNLFKVGATYNWEDKTANPTNEGKQELIEKIKEILKCDFEIIEHLAGVRPTVKDRKPLLGTHPDYKNIHILNGLGTRGVMLGPYMANLLFEHIEKGKPIERENNIIRFQKK